MTPSERKRIFVTVKTYPTPSKKYGELVCVAGLLEDGSLIRIYPVQFREMDDEDQFAKYQWIEIGVEKTSSDTRPESFRPNVDTIQLFEKVPSDGDAWDARREIIFQKPTFTMCELNRRTDDRSLGIVKMRKLLGFHAVPKEEKDYDESMLASWRQGNFLRGKTLGQLVLIPWVFKCRYLCENPDCNGHDMCILDWEMGVLYLKMREQYDEQVAIEKVRQKWEDQICAACRDTWFFVGTHRVHKTWMILGAFWPKYQKPKSRMLF